jgi:hypothetical protein
MSSSDASGNQPVNTGYVSRLRRGKPPPGIKLPQPTPSPVAITPPPAAPPALATRPVESPAAAAVIPPPDASASPVESAAPALHPDASQPARPPEPARAPRPPREPQENGPDHERYRNRERRPSRHSEPATDPNYSASSLSGGFTWSPSENAKPTGSDKPAEAKPAKSGGLLGLIKRLFSRPEDPLLGSASKVSLDRAPQNHDGGSDGGRRRRRRRGGRGRNRGGNPRTNPGP